MDPDTSVQQLAQLARDHRAVLVNDSASLEAATTAALEEIQTLLTGATPQSHYLWDTYAGRPKSEDEISDYLANELGRLLADRGAIINREVQVRRNRPSGVGERTDLLVEASPVGPHATGRLSLPIEVKGAWNPELRTALDDQLVKRYMRDLGADHGLFVVIWPDLISWTDLSDHRRTALAHLDRLTIEDALAQQAAAQELTGTRVRVIHLAIDYLRPR